jgi:heat shock protein HtpX
MAPRDASIVVTAGLLQKLDREELQAAVAHALGHVRNYDTRLMTLVATLGMGSVILAAAVFAGLAGGSGGGGGSERGGGTSNVGLLLPGIIAFLPLWLGMTLFTALIVRVLEMVISDERIYQADVAAAELTRNPLGVVRALKELDSWLGPTRSFSPAISGLCIVGTSGEYERMDDPGFGFRFCLKAHPPMPRRVAAVEELGFLQSHGAAKA